MLHIMPMHLFVTGPKGIGKTTLIRKVLQHMSRERVAGFCTHEIEPNYPHFDSLEGNRRRGLGLLSQLRVQDAKRGSQDSIGSAEVLATLNDELKRAARGVDLILIDEIGKREVQNPLFREALTRFLEGPVSVWATVNASCRDFLKEMEERQTTIVRLTRQCRDRFVESLIENIPRRPEPPPASAEWSGGRPFSGSPSVNLFGEPIPPGAKPMNSREQVAFITRTMRKLGWIKPRHCRKPRKANKVIY